jgi:hypothetical protein
MILQQRTDLDTVLLQAMKQEPPPDAKCRDKFLVQSAPITGDKEFASIATVLESTDKSVINERKIRVNWLPAATDDNTPPVAVTPSKPINGGSTDTPEASRTFASPSGGDSPPPYTDDAKSELEDAKSEPSKSTVGAAAASASVAAKSAFETVKEKVPATQTDSSLRQRSRPSDGESKSATSQLAQAVPQSAQGVPVRITALLCLLAFLVGYVFF